MKRTAIWALLVLLTLVAGVGLARQWQTTARLRIELDALRAEQSGLARLQAENERLKRERLPAAEIARLRANRAAMEQLRGELEKLQEVSPRR